MMSVNKQILVGSVGNNPKLVNKEGTNAVCTFSMATNEDWTDKATGERKHNVQWHRIVCFGKIAEVAQRNVTKGASVYVCGITKSRKYLDKDGMEKEIYEVICKEISVLSKKESAPKEQEEPNGNAIETNTEMQDDLNWQGKQMSTLKLSGLILVNGIIAGIIAITICNVAFCVYENHINKAAAIEVSSE